MVVGSVSSSVVKNMGWALACGVESTNISAEALAQMAP
jgi:hypothetical protein